MFLNEIHPSKSSRSEAEQTTHAAASATKLQHLSTTEVLEDGARVVAAANGQLADHVASRHVTYSQANS